MLIERKSWIDTVKGIAIVLVVIGHVISSYHASNLYTTNMLFNFVHQFVYSFHMALFMMVSGYLFTLSKRRRKQDDIEKRLLSYGVPYLLFTALWVVMKLLMSGYTNSEVTLKDIPLSIFYPVSFMWFIYALMIMQIVQILIGEINHMFHMIFAGGGYLIQPILASNFSSIRFEDCVLNDILKNYIFFLIGIYILPLVLNLLKRTQVTLVTGILLLVGNIILYIYGGNIIAQFTLAILGCSFVIGLTQNFPHCKILEFLGRQTLPIYVLQGFSIAAARLILTKLQMNETTGIFPLMTCTIAGVILPLLVYEISEKLGMANILFYPNKALKHMGNKRNED